MRQDLKRWCRSFGDTRAAKLRANVITACGRRVSGKRDICEIATLLGKVLDEGS